MFEARYLGLEQTVVAIESYNIAVFNEYLVRYTKYCCSNWLLKLADFFEEEKHRFRGCKFGRVYRQTTCIFVWVCALARQKFYCSFFFELATENEVQRTT